ncbi:dihydrofolate reductase family protein [Corynebacterium flavescens]|uniref:dihydrofolate reductase family protein n=1 Tax=Corynebacterium flavescens TaxID=28028 RepID=UPI000EE62CC6|nr:deaminase [Corynebacterium flavescens]
MLDISELLGPDQPGIRLIEATSLVGSATTHGTSGQLGNATDSALFAAMREWADVIVVAAGTVEAEDYGGVAKPSTARIAAVTRSLSLTTDSKFFRVTTPPLVLCPDVALDSPKAQVLREAGAELVGVGDGGVEEIVAALHARGFRRLVVEGGPHLYAGFIAAGLVDKFYLTVDPHLSPSVETPLVNPAFLDSGADSIVPMELENVQADGDGTVFLRYRRRPTA